MKKTNPPQQKRISSNKSKKVVLPKEKSSQKTKDNRTSSPILLEGIIDELSSMLVASDHRESKLTLECAEYSAKLRYASEKQEHSDSIMKTQVKTIEELTTQLDEARSGEKHLAKKLLVLSNENWEMKEDYNRLNQTPAQTACPEMITLQDIVGIQESALVKIANSIKFWQHSDIAYNALLDTRTRAVRDKLNSP